MKVYPRLRGGSYPSALVAMFGQGLSPPTRGIRIRSCSNYTNVRSIPAYAGDPQTGAPYPAPTWVYPRLRGGSLGDLARQSRRQGLSPPTRGIPSRWRVATMRMRSIPAYAGDPSSSRTFLGQRRVYPRLRGGSAPGASRIPIIPGLSPPTRGIHLGTLFAVANIGSIPAYAGDPARRHPHRRILRVYPRLRGGSSTSSGRAGSAMGLSPPTRGIHRHCCKLRGNNRSIPAYAGDPGIVRG